MQRLAASSVAIVLALAAALGLLGCGDDGAEPGSPSEALRPVSLILDFVPNAVHSGIYLALDRNYDEDAGLKLEVSPPPEPTAGPKLLAAGKVDFAVLDIHDLVRAREAGIDIVGVGAIVQRPLGAVIAADGSAIKRPRDLEGHTVGVSGLPSDDAVLDYILESDGADPDAIERVTIGFKSVSLLSAGKLDAATAFWNAEGVELSEMGLATREFRVDEASGGITYPELILATSGETEREQPQLVDDLISALASGYSDLGEDPAAALDALLAANPDLDRDAQAAQLEALDGAFTTAAGQPLALDPAVLADWSSWEAKYGIASDPPSISEIFPTAGAPQAP